MKLLIAGSRNYPRRDLVRRYVERLPADTILLNGGARGVDATAALIAEEQGLAVQYFPAEWAAYGRRAGYLRNKAMVEQADAVVCFMVDGGSAGTQHTIDLARAKGCPLLVYGSNGQHLFKEGGVADAHCRR